MIPIMSAENVFVVACSAILVGLLLIVSWGLHCNERTCLQRKQIINYVFSRSDWMLASRTFARVSYDKHFWYLVMFRDPMWLYPKNIREGYWIWKMVAELPTKDEDENTHEQV